jgi:antitoxin (DNA-binding transcriptional repressor) of toxin-antitoxin stability system
MMNKESDKHRVTRISATEASRTFSRVLDEVEAGRWYVVHRHGRDVCAITGPPAEARLASECLRLLGVRTPVTLDADFGADMLAVIAEETIEERPARES